MMCHCRDDVHSQEELSPSGHLPCVRCLAAVCKQAAGLGRAWGAEHDRLLTDCPTLWAISFVSPAPDKPLEGTRT